MKALDIRENELYEGDIVAWTGTSRTMNIGRIEAVRYLFRAGGKNQRTHDESRATTFNLRVELHQRGRSKYAVGSGIMQTINHDLTDTVIKLEDWRDA